MQEDQPILGEIRMYPVDWAPEGWLPCDGAELPINKYVELAAIIGDTYGGDGKKTFRLPDLRDRAPLGTGPSSSSGRIYRLGDTGGQLAVALKPSELPQHTHRLCANTGSGSSNDPAGKAFARERMGRDVYRAPGDNPVTMSPDSVSSSGESKPHDNVMPSMGIAYFIAWKGVFPTRD